MLITVHAPKGPLLKNTFLSWENSSCVPFYVFEKKYGEMACTVRMCSRERGTKE